jgi:hypothetical protein
MPRNPPTLRVVHRGASKVRCQEGILVLHHDQALDVHLSGLLDRLGLIIGLGLRHLLLIVVGLCDGRPWQAESRQQSHRAHCDFSHD